MEKRKVSRQSIKQPDDPAIRYIALTQGQVAIVDVEDYERLSHWNWRAAWSPMTSTFYAARTSGARPRRTIFMHRVVLNYSGPLDVDHIFGNTLDNRKSQLRLATKAQNQINKGLQRNSSTGMKGVSFRHGKFTARISVSRKSIWLGVFGTAEEAHEAYLRSAKEIYGSFSRAA